MSQDKSKETGLVSMHSEWVGKSYVRTVARRVGKSATLMVDVTEYADRPSKKRASAAARHAAREASATPVKAPAGSVIFEHESVRQTNRLDEDGNLVPLRTRMRTTTFAFRIRNLTETGQKRKRNNEAARQRAKARRWRGDLPA